MRRRTSTRTVTAAAAGRTPARASPASTAQVGGQHLSPSNLQPTKQSTKQTNRQSTKQTDKQPNNQPKNLPTPAFIPGRAIDTNQPFQISHAQVQGGDGLMSAANAWFQSVGAPSPPQLFLFTSQTNCVTSPLMNKSPSTPLPRTRRGGRFLLPL